jgi:hypothetical protein
VKVTKFIKSKAKLLSIIFFTLSFLVLLRVFLIKDLFDYSVTYYSVKLIFSGINPYLTGHNFFSAQVYPPIEMIIFSPFSLLPFFLAEKLWLATSLAALFLSEYLIFKMFKKNIFSSLGFLVLGLTCFSFPVKFTLGMGQVNIIILFFTVLSIYLIQKKGEGYLAVLSIPLSIKFFPIFFPLYFLIKKRWKALISLFLAFIFILILTFLLIDNKIIFYYFREVLPGLIGGDKTYYYSQSLNAFLSRVIENIELRNVIKYLLSILFAGISFFVIFKTRKFKELENFHLGILINLNLIINNFSWQHHFVFSIFPFLVTLFYILDRRLSYKYLIILFISYVLISLNIKNPNNYNFLLLSHVFYGIFIFWLMQIYILLKLPGRKN